MKTFIQQQLLLTNGNFNRFALNAWKYIYIYEQEERFYMLLWFLELDEKRWCCDDKPHENCQHSDRFSFHAKVFSACTSICVYGRVFAWKESKIERTSISEEGTERKLKLTKQWEPTERSSELLHVYVNIEFLRVAISIMKCNICSFVSIIFPSLAVGCCIRNESSI